MAIDFRCNCGKRFQAQEQFAGRSLKCPRCRDVLAIPRPGMAAGLVHFACTCGKRMKAHQADAGAVADCPRCHRELVIPARSQAPAPIHTPHSFPPSRRPFPEFAPPPPSSATLRSAPVETKKPRSAPAPDTLFVQYATPWLSEEVRRQGGKTPRERSVNGFPWLGAAIVLLLAGILVGGAILARDVPYGKAAEVELNDLTLIPSDAVEMASVRYYSLWKDKEHRHKDSAILETAKEWTKDLALTDSNIERVTLVWLPPYKRSGMTTGTKTLPTPFEDKKLSVTPGDNKGAGENKNNPKMTDETGKPANDICLIVRLRFPVEPEFQPIKTAVDSKKDKKDKADTTQKVKFGWHHYYQAAKQDRAWLFPSNKIVVLSTAAGIEHFLASQAEMDETHPLKSAVASAGKHDMTIGLNFRTHRPVLFRDGQNPYAWMTFQKAVMTVDEGRAAKRNLTADLRMDFATPEEAKVVKEWKEAETKNTKTKLTSSWQSIDLNKNIVTIRYQADANRDDELESLRMIDSIWKSLAGMAQENGTLKAR